MLVGGALCAAALGSREARADNPEHTPSVHLDVARDGAVPGCPGAAEVAASANHVLGHDRVRTADTDPRDAELRILVAFSRDHSGFGATVREAGARDGERILRTSEPTCDTLTSALGATIAMMIDAADAARDFVLSVPTTAEAEKASAMRLAQAPSHPPLSAQQRDRVGSALDDGDDSRAVGYDQLRGEEALANRRTALDGVFAEALGNGLYDSLNYERMFYNGVFSVRVGLGFAPLNVCLAPCGSPAPGPAGAPQYRRADEFTMPVLASWFWGSASHKLQVGLGVTGIYRTGQVGHDAYQTGDGTFLSEKEAWFTGGQYDSVFSSANKGFDLAGTAVVGYRFIPAHGGPTFGGGLTPLFGAHGVLPWLCVNAGAEFM
ncbi:MAG TPA: hypothetical protein VEK07_09395 [Polyangiaceae bacterium]|nr:hypothetical protein [Polyangiaceae bacterium]